MSTMSLEKQQTQALQTRAETTVAEPLPIAVPRSDIYETPNAVVLVMDMPGVEAGNVEVTVEQDVLTVLGRSTVTHPAGFNLGYREYLATDFRREFRLSEEVDRDQITAQVKDGVLTLSLPKVEQAKPRKISVSQG